MKLDNNNNNNNNNNITYNFSLNIMKVKKTLYY